MTKSLNTTSVLLLSSLCLTACGGGSGDTTDVETNDAQTSISADDPSTTATTVDQPDQDDVVMTSSDEPSTDTNTTDNTDDAAPINNADSSAGTTNDDLPDQDDLVATNPENPDTSEPTDSASQSDNAVESVSTVNLSQDDLLLLGVYQSEPLVEVVTAIAVDITSEAEAEILSLNVAIPEDSFYGNSFNDPEPIISERYNCSGGGTMTVDAAITFAIGSNGGSADYYFNYQFDQCVHTTSSQILPVGSHTLSGSARLESTTGAGGGGRSTTRHRWSQFEITLSNGIGYVLDGQMQQGTFGSSAGGGESRDAIFSQYIKTVDGEVSSLFDNVSFLYSENETLATDDFLLNVSGGVRAEQFEGETINIASNPALSRTRDFFEPAQGEPLSGLVEMTATGGSSLLISANPALDSDPNIPGRSSDQIVDVASMTADGTIEIMLGIPLIDIPLSQQSCFFSATDLENANACFDGVTEMLVLP